MTDKLYTEAEQTLDKYGHVIWKPSAPEISFSTSPAKTMTDIDKRIDEIIKLDRERTKGELTSNDNFIHIKLETETAYHNAGDNPILMQFWVHPDNEADANFYAKAPEMVSIIKELQAQVVERDSEISTLKICYDSLRQDYEDTKDNFKRYAKTIEAAINKAGE